MPAPDNPRYRVLVDNEDELQCLGRVKEVIESGERISRVAEILNEQGVPPPRSKKWTRGSVYHFKCRLGWHAPKPNNQRSHSDEEVKARMHELKAKGHTYQAIANILNEQGYVPLCGAKFTRNSVMLLLRCRGQDACQVVASTRSTAPRNCPSSGRSTSGVQSKKGPLTDTSYLAADDKLKKLAGADREAVFAQHYRRCQWRPRARQRSRCRRQ